MSRSDAMSQSRRGSGRSALGRGLAALIPEDVFDTPPAPERKALREVRLDEVTPNPEQPRMTFSEGALEQLAESIRSHGVLTPLLVRNNPEGRGFVLIAGERRLRAAGLAGLEYVPVWVREDVSDREQLELALVENIQREDLDPIETAEAYDRLIGEFGLTQAEVARRVGKDRATVANAVRLLKLPDFALTELRSGRITAGHAKALLAAPDDTKLKQALRDVVLKDLSVRATERLVASMQRPEGGRRDAVRRAVDYLGDRLSRALGTRVRIEPRTRGERGRIVIDYHSREDLDRITALLGG